MTMWISREDVAGLVSNVTQMVAEQLSIQDVDWKSAGELMGEIRQVSPTVADRLRDFLFAYEEWYLMHEYIEHHGRPERWLAILTECIEARDNTRGALKAALAKDGSS